MVVVVRRAVERDWPACRAIRLQALAEAPTAFASTYEHESGFADDRWREWITNAAQFLAETSDGEVIGTVTGVTDTQDGAVVHLVAMFVTEAARRRGVGERLVAAVVDQAALDGADRVLLQVVETNLAAQRLYARCGFVRTGATARLPHSQELLEHEMALTIRTGVGGPI